jgi:hypothetical protein
VSNWVNQAKQFFDSANLVVKEWDLKAWNEDEGNDGTVWVVKESLLTSQTTNSVFPQPVSTFFRVFGTPTFHHNVRLLSTFADEAHLAWRSDSSQRSHIYKKIVACSEFNVLLSGTMFPLGPSEDAKGILEHLGGSLDDKDGLQSKWNDKFGRAFRRLILEGDQFSVLAFRILISHFYLRRTPTSFWKGKWIVKDEAARPVPMVVLPYPDDFSHNPKMKDTETRQRAKNTLNEMMKRADRRRFYAWTELYAEVYNAGLTGDSSASRRKIEKMMMERLPYLRPSGRLRKLIALIKAHRARGEKFVLVSDRIFLLQLAYYVFPTLMFSANFRCVFMRWD